MKNNIIYNRLLVFCLGFFLLGIGACSSENRLTNSGDNMSDERLATANLALGDGLFARISTNRGDIVVRLEYESTPITVTNFVALAEGRMSTNYGTPYYDGLTFHRVISDFMIQGGCPMGTGAGGPGYEFPDEIVAHLRHDGPGILSMANAGPGTNGSQFFITHVETPWLDGAHTVFGRVVSGQNVVNAIRQGDRINTIRIIRNGERAAAFRADQDTFDDLIRNIGAEDRAIVQAQRERDQAALDEIFANALTSPSGLRWVVETPGTGPKPASGSTVVVNMRGFFLTGQYFDNSDLTGGSRELPLGTGRIIPGLDEAFRDMNVGERRLVVIPPELAYGSRGIDNLIPPNSFLIYDLELVRIR